MVNEYTTKLAQSFPCDSHNFWVHHFYFEWFQNQIIYWKLNHVLRKVFKKIVDIIIDSEW